MVSVDKLGVRDATRIRPADGESYAAIVRSARKLLHANRQAVGLVPANAKIGIPPVAARLAVGLLDLSVTRVLLFDANTRDPAFSDLIPNRANSEGYIISSIADNIHVCTWAGRDARGLDLSELKRQLQKTRADYQLILVDLTGFSELGEHLAAYQMLDGVIAVAEAGIGEHTIEVCSKQIPPEKNMGVLLLG